MKLLVSVSAFALASVLGSAAFAADLIVDNAAIDAASPAATWEGAYIGAHLGGGVGNVTWESLPTGFFSGEYDVGGWIGGVQAGINFQSNNIVYGVEADVSWSNIEGDDDDLPGAVSAVRTLDWTGSLRGRLGFSAESFLLYGTAGIAVAQSTLDYDGVILDTVDTATHLGLTVGVGAEFMATDNVSLRGEYRYTTYGDETYQASILDISTGFDTHTATVGVNFHF